MCVLVRLKCSTDWKDKIFIFIITSATAHYAHKHHACVPQRTVTRFSVSSFNVDSFLMGFFLFHIWIRWRCFFFFLSSSILNWPNSITYSLRWVVEACTCVSHPNTLYFQSRSASRAAPQSTSQCMLRKWNNLRKRRARRRRSFTKWKNVICPLGGFKTLHIRNMC